MLKSHKLKKQADVGGEEVEAPRHKRRKMTLAQLEKKVARRRVSTGANGVMGVIKSIGAGVQRLNQEMAKQGRKMPSSRDLNKDIWG